MRVERCLGYRAATASFHLAKLLEGGLLSPALPVRTLRQSREAAALAEARTSYDHLAGRAGGGVARRHAPRPAARRKSIRPNGPGRSRPESLLRLAEQVVQLGLDVDTAAFLTRRDDLVRALEERRHRPGGHFEVGLAER